jgi:hypothetical protein
VAASSSWQPRQLDPHLHPQRRVQVRERLVEQEHLRLPDDRPADRDPLPLAARRAPSASCQQLLEVEDARASPTLALRSAFDAPPAAG